MCNRLGKDELFRNPYRKAGFVRKAGLVRKAGKAVGNNV
jgi:hypothetical protein